MSQDLTLFPSGKIILCAHIESVSREAADRVAELLLAIKKYTDESEPGCFVFRVSRFETKFVVFEEYEDQKAVQVHFESEPFKALAAAAGTLTVKPPLIEYYRELP